MPSKIFMICDAYESGFGHGLQEDGHNGLDNPYGDPDHNEAYQIGYQAGLERRHEQIADAKWNSRKC
jgi:hypothetical protein